uniref:Putative mitochondrial protein n=1 Tax=Tanacetum cinerariifolium TaxID=118510 RepID=A0A699JFV5_TANCI|nr:putative mitochondrial protein [Tanacetum cinerariifolium]
MIKADDLKLEFNLYQEDMNVCLTTLENELAAMRLEANQRHEQSNQRHEQSTKMQKEMMRMTTELMKKNSHEVESTEGFRTYDTSRYLKQVLQGKKELKGGIKKLKMPIFDGEDAYGWIYRMERFFKIQGVEALEQIKVTKLCLEGRNGALFEKLAGQPVGVSEQVLEATFIKGLKPDLRASVRVMHPEGLNHAMILAVTIEETKGFDNGARGGWSYHLGETTSNFSGYKNNTTSSTRTLLSTSSTGNKGRISNIRRIRDREVAVLIDCGATHNFISSKIIEELGLAISDSGTFNVTLGNGETTRSKGICKGLVVVFSEIQVLEDFLPLELGSTDKILGINWLQTLGDVKIN